MALAVGPTVGLFRGEDGAQLLHEAQEVHLDPVLDNESVLHPPDINVRDLHLPASWRDAKEFALVRGSPMPTRRDLIAVCQEILSADPDIRERPEEGPNALFETLAAGYRRRERALEVRGHELVNGLGIMLIDDFLEEAADDSLVLFGGHGNLLEQRGIGAGKQDVSVVERDEA